MRFAEHFAEDAARDDEFASGVMLRNGIPEDVVQALRTVSSAFRSWGAGEGDPAAARRRARSSCATARCEVLHRPGHSPSDTVFWDARRRILIAADHLIKHISSNPLISRPLDEDDDPARRAAAGARDLHRVAAQDARAAGRDRALRARRADHRPRLADRRAAAFHARRAEQIHELIAERPRSGYELAQALFGNVAVTQAYLTLSEVLGHVDLLLEDGRVREDERDGVVVFEAAA